MRVERHEQLKNKVKQRQKDREEGKVTQDSHELVSQKVEQEEDNFDKEYDGEVKMKDTVNLSDFQNQCKEEEEKVLVKKPKEEQGDDNLEPLSLARTQALKYNLDHQD